MDTGEYRATGEYRRSSDTEELGIQLGEYRDRGKYRDTGEPGI